MIPSAYVHVPFCASICSYCAFSRSANLRLIEPWLQRITNEITNELSAARQKDPDFALQTIYIGGGTPSVLSTEQLARLLVCLKDFFDPQGEWTIEANPESMDEEKLALCKAMGVNRLSIGVQSFDDQRLKALGRRHTAARARESFEAARIAGFDNISLDLMYGFVDESLEQLNADLECFLALDAEHLSIYSLILEPDSVLGKRSGYEEIEEEAGALQYERIEEVLQKAGYEHYEISSYAKNGRYGEHNCRIWMDGPYYGFGYGAIGRDDTGLHHFAGSLADYVSGKGNREYEPDDNPWFDALMTGLRTVFGIDVEAWNDKYQKDLEKEFAGVLRKYPDGLCIENGRLKATKKGMEILDSILVDFLLCE